MTIFLEKDVPLKITSSSIWGWECFNVGDFLNAHPYQFWILRSRFGSIVSFAKDDIVELQEFLRNVGFLKYDWNENFSFLLTEVKAENKQIIVNPIGFTYCK